MRESRPSFLSGAKPYIVAEVGGNHGGDVGAAKSAIRAAAEAGVDAVKFQLYHGDRLVAADEPPLPQVSDEYDSQRARFQDLELGEPEWRECVSLSKELGLDFAASVFDQEMVDFAAEVCSFLKIASGDLTNTPLLRAASETGLPIVLSTGCATMSEIRKAVHEIPTDRLTLLHCVGSYPTPLESANLQLIDHLQGEFEVSVGYSDHTVGTLAAQIATAKSACIIEKHFTTDPQADQADSSLSAAPAEMRELVEKCRKANTMVGHEDRSTSLSVETDCAEMRRSLVTARPLATGETVAADDLVALRPERGVPANRIDEVLGRTVRKDLPANTFVEFDDFK